VAGRETGSHGGAENAATLPCASLGPAQSERDLLDELIPPELTKSTFQAILGIVMQGAPRRPKAEPSARWLMRALLSSAERGTG